MDAPRLSVCISTYHRVALLDTLLGELVAQTRRPQQVVVVDNDPLGSARDVVTAWRQRYAEIDWVYDVQPEKNISLTRNRTIALADGAWLAFIDDDERAHPQWLEALETARVRHEADGVLAPIVPVVPPDAPDWVRRGRFYDDPHMPSGTIVPHNVMRIGNALLSAAWLKRIDPVFDPAFGLTGGEDGDMLMRLANLGARLVWSEEAGVTEPVVAARMRLDWILKRALRGGQDFGWHFRGGKLGGRPGFARSLLFFARAAAQAAIAGILAVLMLVRGRHHAVYWAARCSANLGKLSVLGGLHYREYA
ncbi:glycosyltransferase [Pararobbsia silviterrae]|uniref:Glycosyltransferase n=2 Tax=Pararobbsia silviterrae TaxID=1792498 RepID=A0A494XSH2_9BURK|nr:glycosyltransferase [Pararobbsia silviterrae]